MLCISYPVPASSMCLFGDILLFPTNFGNGDSENPELNADSVRRTEFRLSIKPVNERKDWRAEHTRARDNVIASDI